MKKGGWPRLRDLISSNELPEPGGNNPYRLSHSSRYTWIPIFSCWTLDTRTQRDTSRGRWTTTSDESQRICWHRPNVLSLACLSTLQPFQKVTARQSKGTPVTRQFPEVMTSSIPTSVQLITRVKRLYSAESALNDWRHRLRPAPMPCIYSFYLDKFWHKGGVSKDDVIVGFLILLQERLRYSFNKAASDQRTTMFLCILYYRMTTWCTRGLGAFSVKHSIPRHTDLLLI